MKFKVNDYVRLAPNHFFSSKAIYQIDDTFVDLFGNECYIIRVAEEETPSYTIYANQLEKFAELY